MAKVDPLIEQSAVKVAEDYVKVIIKLDDAAEKLLKTSVELDKQLGKQTGLKNNTERQRANKKAASEAAKLQKQYTQIVKKAEVASGTYAKGIAKQTELLRKQKAETKAWAKEQTAAAGSVNKLKAQVEILKLKLNDVNLETREGQIEAARLRKEIDKKNKVINKATGRYQGLGKALKGFGRQLLGALGITAGLTGLAIFGKDLLNIANSLQQVQRRAKIVFGTSFPEIEKAATNLSKKMGVTNNEFINAATNTGDLLIPLDFTRETAAKMSVELQSLAGALDEWTGGTIGVTEVSNILTKAMLGENEQLKRLGIAIRQDSEEFRNLVESIQETNGVTKAQARAMATLELIQKKSADAQSAYAVGGTNILRIQKQLTLGWKNIKEGIADLITVEDRQSDVLRKQQIMFNTLVSSIQSENNTNETRLKFIEKLNKQYPDLVKNIDLEAASEEELNKWAGEVNKRYEERIKLITAQEIYKDYVEDIIELQRQEIQFIQTIEGINQGLIGGAETATGTASDMFISTENLYNSQTAALERNRAEQKSIYDQMVRDVETLGVSMESILGGGDAAGDGDGGKNRINAIRLESAERIESGQNAADILDMVWENHNRKRIALLTSQIKSTADLDGREITFAEARAEAILQIEKETQDGIRMERRKTEEASFEQFDKEVELQEMAKEAWINVAAEASNAIFSIYQNRLNAQLDALSKNLQYELELNEGNEEAQDRIRAKFDKKEAQIRRKQAVSAKVQAIFNATISTAQAILASAQLGFPAAIPFVIAAAALGAIQTAVIASQPIPQFAEGGVMERTGQAIVGEQGRELGIEPTGKVFLTGRKAERRKLKAGTRIIPNPETEQLLSSAKGYDSREIMELAGVIKDENKKTRRAIVNKREVTIIPSKGKITERKGQYFKNYRNAKVKF